MGRRKLGFEGWEERIYRPVRVGDLGGQKSETEPLGSVSGAPLEMAVRGEGGGGGGVVRMRWRSRRGRAFDCTSGGGGFEVKIPKPSHVARFWASSGL